MIRALHSKNGAHSKFMFFKSIKFNESLPLWRHSSTCGASDDDYQYLAHNKVPMWHFQPSLPRLPLPPLDRTCQRYLASQKALLTDEKYRDTERIVHSFLQNEGKNLHNELLAFNKRNKRTSYISEMWLDMYLSSRDPLPINSNPLIGCKDDPRSEYNDQLVRASNMLISSLRFMKSLKAKRLEPQVYHRNPAVSDTDTFRNLIRLVPSRLSCYVASLFKATPLDMSQYVGLFNGTRIPQVGTDVLQRAADSRHMLVIRNGHLYVFDVLDDNGTIREAAYIHACLAKVLSNQTAPCEFPLAALTTLERNSWVNVRHRLLSVGNHEALQTIDSAIFILSLDDTSTEGDMKTAIGRMLHGDGSNIWFDKSLQLTMMKDGLSSIILEHSSVDGVPALRYMNEVFKDSVEKPQIHPGSSPMSIDDNSVRRLEFNLDCGLQDEIKAALQNVHNTTRQLHINFIRAGYGKKLFKANALSPDSMMQLSFQIAYLKCTGKVVATYEPCSTASFLHGRTETIRPATLATKQCAEAFVQRQPPSNEELKLMMTACSQLHSQLAKEAAAGHGFDRHLFALKVLCERAKQPLPAFFQDPAYKSINHNILSTSTLSSPAYAFCAFGPVVKDGLGLGYAVDDNELRCAITNYHAHSDGDQFSQCLLETWEQMHKVLQ